MQRDAGQAGTGAQVFLHEYQTEVVDAVQALDLVDTDIDAGKSVFGILRALMAKTFAAGLAAANGGPAWVSVAIHPAGLEFVHDYHAAILPLLAHFGGLRRVF